MGDRITKLKGKSTRPSAGAGFRCLLARELSG
jgi:hypothetical protein